MPCRRSSAAELLLVVEAAAAAVEEEEKRMLVLISEELEEGLFASRCRLSLPIRRRFRGRWDPVSSLQRQSRLVAPRPPSYPRHISRPLRYDERVSRVAMEAHRRGPRGCPPPQLCR